MKTGYAEDDDAPNVQRAAIIDNRRDFDRLVRYVRENDEHGLRDEVAVRLSFQCGLRAKEIALLEWKRHVLTPSGDIADDLRITKDIGKKCVARLLPLENVELRRALAKLRKLNPKGKYVFHPIGVNAQDEHLAPNSVVQWFKRLYEITGFDGCSSHTGRRTFITTLARRMNDENCSIIDVKRLAGHRRLQTTAIYIEPQPQVRHLAASVMAKAMGNSKAAAPARKRR